MTDITLMTRASDPTAVLPSLALLTHRVQVMPLSTDQLAKIGAGALLLIDAREDLANARIIRRLAHSCGLNIAVIAIVTEGGFSAVNAQWYLTDVILEHATPAEIEGRLRLALEANKRSDEYHMPQEVFVPSHTAGMPAPSHMIAGQTLPAPLSRRTTRSVGARSIGNNPFTQRSRNRNTYAHYDNASTPMPNTNTYATNRDIRDINEEYMPSGISQHSDNRHTLTEHDGILESSGLVMNLAAYTAHLHGLPLDLAYKEFELLRYLMQHAGRAFTRIQFLQEVWGHDYYGGTRTVDVHIRRLRAKLGVQHEQLIVTVRNVGYRFTPDTSQASPMSGYTCDDGESNARADTQVDAHTDAHNNASNGSNSPSNDNSNSLHSSNQEHNNCAPVATCECA